VDELFEAIAKIRNAGVTILLVEQHLAESLAIADSAIVLQTGHIVIRGSSREVSEHPDVQRAYLGT
jgi:branched-chain amino acid transport system ATP-binding protein